MIEQLKTIREALLCTHAHMQGKALTALDQIEQAVGSVEPVARLIVNTSVGGRKLSYWQEPASFDLPDGEYPLYTTPPAQQPQYEAGDMASAHNDGFRAGVASVAQQPQAEAVQPWCPDVCPITGKPFFMWIEHHKTGQSVPTYGGPYDSYTIPVRDDDGSFCCERYDHDNGWWVTDELHDVGLQIVSDQAYVSDKPPQQAEAVPPANLIDPGVVVSFAVDRWFAEVANRPLVNVHRRTLDDTWRQVIRRFGGDPEALLGPNHDAMIAAAQGEKP